MHFASDRVRLFRARTGTRRATLRGPVARRQKDLYLSEALITCTRRLSAAKGLAQSFSCVWPYPTVTDCPPQPGFEELPYSIRAFRQTLVVGFAAFGIRETSKYEGAPLQVRACERLPSSATCGIALDPVRPS